MCERHRGWVKQNYREVMDHSPFLGTEASNIFEPTFLKYIKELEFGAFQQGP